MTDHKRRRARLWLALIGVSMLLPQLGLVVLSAHRAFAGDDAVTTALGGEQQATDSEGKDGKTETLKKAAEAVSEAVREKSSGSGGALGAPKTNEEATEGEATEAEAARPFTPAEPPALPHFEDVKDPQVLILPIEGTIDLGLAPFIDRALEETPDVTLVILDVDTFGGRIDAAVKIRDRLLDLSVPTVAFIDRRAISAGALISLATDAIVFAPGGSMGAATPIQINGGEAEAVGEKMVSYFRSEMRATAEAKGRDSSIAEAMVDASIAIEGVIDEGKLLTVTTEEALKLGLATAKHDTLDDLLDAMGLASARTIRPEPNWAEQLARFLSDPVVSGLLMSLGMLGLMIELWSPGLGIPGALGVTCMALFFGGHLVVDLAGWEEMTLFLLGLVSLGLEIFVIPGFGVAGVLGLLLITASLVFTMVGMPMEIAWETGEFERVLSNVVLAMVGTGALLIAAIKYLPKNPMTRGLVLSTTLGDASEAPRDRGTSFQSAPEGLRELQGKRGVASSDLRMAGKAMIDGQLIDVVSRMAYIDKGTPVVVVEVEGARVVVIEDESAAPV